MKKLMTVAVSCVLIVAACSDSDGDGAFLTQEEPDTEQSESDAPADATPAPEPDEPVDDADDGNDSDAEPDLVSGGDWCGFAAGVDELFNVGAVDLFDPESVEQWIGDTSGAISQAQSIAPPEIADDVAAYVDGFSQFADIFEQVDYQITSLDDTDLAFLEENPAFAAAGPNITQYNEEVCGIVSGVPVPSDSDVPEIDDLDAEDLGDLDDLEGQIVTGFIAAGFTPEEAQCLGSRISIEDLATADDPTELLGIFQDCGIGLDRLAEIG